MPSRNNKVNKFAQEHRGKVFTQRLLDDLEQDPEKKAELLAKIAACDGLTPSAAYKEAVMDVWSIMLEIRPHVHTRDQLIERVGIHLATVKGLIEGEAAAADRVEPDDAD